jgi:hypothetical protein
MTMLLWASMVDRDGREVSLRLPVRFDDETGENLTPLNLYARRDTDGLHIKLWYDESGHCPHWLSAKVVTWERLS